MRSKLTVSEVGKLLGVSAHTIRYYDKVGLITSELDDENGYRFFDLDDIVRLSNVLILRDSGIPIKQIKSLINDYSAESYKTMLKESLEQLDLQLNKLKLQKNVVKNTLSLIEEDSKTFKIINYPERYLDFLYVEIYDEPKTARGFFQRVQDQSIDNLVYKDLYYELRDDDMHICVESNKETDLSLPAGDYLEYALTIDDESEIGQAIIELMTYAFEHQFNLDDNLYMRIEPHAMLVVDAGIGVRIFSKINN